METNIRAKVGKTLDNLSKAWSEVVSLTELFEIRNTPEDSNFTIFTFGYSVFISDGELAMNIFEALDQMEKQGYLDYKDFKQISF
jgi:hypothetical protein